VSEDEGANREKVENIGNSYFPTLAVPLFAPGEVIAGGNTSRGSKNMRRVSW